jgi:hypothetical protein
MSSNMIPESVPAIGPMYQRLPNELIFEVIKDLLLLLPPVSRPGVIIDKKRFDILNALNCFLNIRRVNKTFDAMAMQAFYLANDFTFKATEVFNHKSPWKTSLAPALPPAHFRNYLRRIQIHITLEDYCTITNSGKDNASMRCQITSVEDFFAVSLGARMLRDLTCGLTGFSNLDFLDLHIYTDFCYDKQMALGLVKEAAFVVCARCVQVVIEAPAGDGMVASTPWCPELAELVAVKCEE